MKLHLLAVGLVPTVLLLPAGSQAKESIISYKDHAEIVNYPRCTPDPVIKRRHYEDAYHPQDRTTATDEIGPIETETYASTSMTGKILFVSISWIAI